MVLATLASAVVFLLAGALSGQLLDEHDGMLSAIEWVLRTVVVVAAVVFIVAGSLLVLRVRRFVRRRALGWLVAIAAWGVFAWFVAVPVGFAVYLSHLPSRREVRDADVGARKQAIALAGADGVRLRGWYVPSRNGAAVIAMHGTASNRLGVVEHVRLLARHGYGVLALDLRGHGESQGRSTSAPWKLDEDLDAALRWVAARPDVEPERIGLLGVSLGGEVALRVAARRRDVGATVAEGAMGQVRDARLAGASPPTLAQLAALTVLSALLTGERPQSDADVVERIAPRPLLLISAGGSTEAAANRVFHGRAGAPAEHWNLPEAPHASALEVDPDSYERRVVGFLDEALAASP